MSLINRRFNCTGLRIPLPGPWQLELWWCPRGAVIPMHCHPNVESMLVFLAGKMRWRFQIGETSVIERVMTWSNFMKGYCVPPNADHGAEVTGRFGLFANLEYWSGPKTSAATDLELA